MMRLASVLHLALGAAAQVSPDGRGGRGGRGGRPDYSHLPVSHRPAAAIPTSSLRCVCVPFAMRPQPSARGA